jgi:hypothetical protein
LNDRCGPSSTGSYDSVDPSLVAVAWTNHGAVGYHDIIEPLGGFDIRRSLPDAMGPPPKARRPQVHEFYMGLVPCLIQRWAYSVMPRANDIPGCLHDIKDV